MDVCSKLQSSILNQRLFKLLDAHGIKSHFGGTPNLGCQDGQFTLKILLHLRHQHQHPSFVAFIGLIKAYHNVNHKLLFDILKKYGAPTNLVDVIARTYSDLNVILKHRQCQSRNAPNSWCETRRQHGTCPLSIPHLCGV